MLAVVVSSIGLACYPTTTATAPEASPRILFYRSQPNGGSGHLFVMNPDGTDVVQLGRSGSRPDHYPSWSPDGSSIVFESYRQGGWRIWIMDADGTNAHRVMTGRSGTGTYEFDPSFSSDGRRILFVSGRDIFSVGIDGRNLEQLTRTPDVFEFGPRESPDGQRLLFVARGDDGTDIVVANRDGSDRRNISNHRSRSYAPVWSPDRSQIAFYSDRTGSFEPFLMNADGSQQRPLLSPEQIARAGFGDVEFIDPWDNDWGATTQYTSSFSCDGSKILFSREIDRNRELFIARTDGSGLTRLTTNRLLDGFPAWGPCVS